MGALFPHSNFTQYKTYFSFYFSYKKIDGKYAVYDSRTKVFPLQVSNFNIRILHVDYIQFYSRIQNMHFLNLLLNCLTFDIRLIEQRRVKRERKKILKAERTHFVLTNIAHEIEDESAEVQAKIVSHTLRYYDDFVKTVISDQKRMTCSG